MTTSRSRCWASRKCAVPMSPSTPCTAIRKGRWWPTNTHKPGCPSHTYHSYFIATLRLVLEAEAQPGNQGASKHSSPGLGELLGRIARAELPAFIRGDHDWGTQANMAHAEQEGIDYLLKLGISD